MSEQFESNELGFTTSIILTPEQYDKFIELLDSPPKPLSKKLQDVIDQENASSPIKK